jgi:copper(I)-binding protein
MSAPLPTPTRRRGRRLVQALGRPRLACLAVSSLAVLPLLAACDAGQQASTATESPDVIGVHGGVGDVVLDDVFIDGSATVATGASIPLRGALTDDGPAADRLLSVSTPAAASVELLGANGQPSTGGIPIPAYGQVDAVHGSPQMLLVDVASPIGPVALVPVTFTFADAGSVTLDVPVATSGGHAGLADLPALPSL